MLGSIWFQSIKELKQYTSKIIRENKTQHRIPIQVGCKGND